MQLVAAAQDLRRAGKVGRAALEFLADIAGLEIEDLSLVVALGLHREDLLAGEVLELDLVELAGLAAAIGRFRFQARLGLVGGQVVGRHVLVVDHGAGDDRPIGVAADIGDDDLLADARDDLAAPVLAGPGLRHAHTAGGRVLLAVPMEAQPDPAVFVDVDIAFLALVLLADHLGGVGADMERGGCHLRGAEALVGFLQLVGAVIDALVGALGRAIALHAVTVRRPHHQELGILRPDGMIGELHQCTGGEAGRLADGVAPLVLRLLGLDLDAGELLALATIEIGTRIVEDLVGLGARKAVLGTRRQVRGGFLEIVVLQLDLAGPQPTLRRPLRQMLDAPPLGPVRRHERVGAGRSGEGRLCRRGHRIMRVACIRQDQLVIPLAVLEVVVDAVLLHQAQDEVEIGLAILHAIVDFRWRLADAVLEARLVLLAEDRLDDVDRRLVLEDAAIRPLREQPEPGSQHEAIMVEILLAAEPLRLDQDAVEDPVLTALQRHLDVTFLAN